MITEFMNKSPLISVMLAFILLNIIPTMASDYTLNIFGNANMDDAIDEDDIEYVRSIIEGTNEATELSDANYDGVIDDADVTQIQLIIQGLEEEITVIDSSNRVVTVQTPPKRVVTLNRHFLEVLQSFNLQNSAIIGVPDGIKRPGYDLLYPKFQDAESISGGQNPASEPDCEAILELYPDLVILYSFYSGSDATQEALESAGVTVLRLSFNRPSKQDLFNEETKKIGYIFGTPDEAQELIDFYEKCANIINSRIGEIPDEDRPKVYCESFRGPYDTSERYARVEIAGGQNIFPDLDPDISVVVDPEEVVSQNPDIIVKMVPNSVNCGYELDAGDTEALEQIREDIMNRPELQNVNAVKNERVYVISGHIMSAGPFSGCRYFVQDAYDAKWFHPDLFEDLDPKDLHQEYLTTFQGLDIDLKENGVFVYPELI